MRRLQFKFPSQIRISGWDFGSSARAMNQAGGYISTQAELGKRLNSTTERKKMSSTIKRVALVAVAALGLGSVSAISANAVPGTVYAPFVSTASTVDADAAGGVYAATALTAITSSNAPGVAYTAGLVSNSVATLSVPLSSAVVLTVNGNGGTFTASDSTTVSLNGQVVTGTAAAAATTTTVSFTAPATAGSYSMVVGVTSANSTSINLTLVVGSAAPSTTYNHSTVYISTTTNADATADSATLSAAAAGTPATPVAAVTVAQYSSVDATTRSSDAAATAVAASISGAGAIGLAVGGTNRGSSLAVAAAAASTHGGAELTTGVQTFYVFPDSRTGAATLSVSVNGVVVSTKTFTFLGTTTKIAEDATVSPSKVYIGVGSTGTLTYKGYDALGNVSEAAPAAIDYAVSSDTSVATVTATNGVVTVTALKAGTATITTCNTASCSSPTLSATANVQITGTTLGSVALAWDNSSYAPGEKMTLTITAKDSAGLPLADGTTIDLFGTALTSNVALQGFVAPADTATLTVKGGILTVTAYAPLASGTVTVSGTDATAAGNAISASAVVVSSTDSAVDAANEATDAANAATDAANAAAEAADAATAAAQDAQAAAMDAQAAVAALATSVASLIAGIKAQITTLTNLVIKIQKKVKA